MNSSKLSILAALALAPSLLAQLPASKFLTEDVAKLLAEEAIVKCQADGFKVSVIVVDQANVMKVFLRVDGTNPATVESAKMKAAYAMTFHRPSGPQTPLPAGQQAPPSPIPGTQNLPGGLPIKYGDFIIGAIGVSGAPGGDKDQGCAQAALTKYADKLK